MRVLHVIARMPGSGTERQLAGMLRAAHGTLWDSTLCVLHGGYPLTAELRADGIPVIELGDSNTRPDVFAWRLRRVIRDGRFDVVHSSLWGMSALTRVVAATTKRPAIVVSERRVEDFRKPWQRQLDRVLSPLADQYIGNSADVAKFIRRSHGAPASRVTMIRNGIDGSVFHPKPDGPASNGRVRIGALGRLIEQKGFDVLISALPSVLEKHDAEIVIVGDGELRDQLVEQAGELPVEFRGFVASQPEVATFLRSLDVFVMPSRYEGLPNAMLEAIACGVPGVATDVAGMREATGDAALLVPPNNPDALAKAINDVIEGNWKPGDASEVPSFADVAKAHLGVFERAVTSRHA